VKAAPWAVAFAGALVLAGCQGRLDPKNLEGTERDIPPSGSTVTYDCDDGRVVQATFDEVYSVHLVTQGLDRTLPSVMSERGAKYKLSTTEFRVEGDNATLETGTGKTQCSARS
jgi:membrane-bound inhibitor of C-type lysozyme